MLHIQDAQQGRDDCVGQCDEEYEVDYPFGIVEIEVDYNGDDDGREYPVEGKGYQALDEDASLPV